MVGGVTGYAILPTLHFLFLSGNVHALIYLILSYHLDAKWHDYIVISFHIIFYASVAFRLHFSMSN